jgi:hypothetical protein
MASFETALTASFSFLAAMEAAAMPSSKKIMFCPAADPALVVTTTWHSK